MAGNNITPLHQTVHYRKLRELIVKSTKKVGIDVSKYDLQNIRCYRTTGKDLMGKTIKFTNLPYGRSTFVDDNSYEIYECPRTTNKHKFVGEYLVFYKDTSFGYYGINIMNYKININNNIARKEITFKGICQFTATLDSIKIDIFPSEYMNRGFNRDNVFNMLGRDNAYSFSEAKYLDEKVISKSKMKISSNDKVKIYKDKKQNNNKQNNKKCIVKNYKNNKKAR